MTELTKQEMNKISGGASYTTAINTILKAITALFSVGQAVGSAIRRATSGSYCKV